MYIDCFLVCDHVISGEVGCQFGFFAMPDGACVEYCMAVHFMNRFGQCFLSLFYFGHEHWSLQQLSSPFSLV